MTKKSTIGEIINPIRVDFNFRDTIQIIVGAFVLAVPVGFTQEVWDLGETLPFNNILILIGMTLFFIGIFTYYHYHREHMRSNLKYHIIEFTKRVAFTYIISFVIVAGLMAAINVTPWQTNPSVAFNIVVLVTFPAAIGAVISDRIR